MMKSEDGYLILADVSGYTAYLTEAEQEHAGPIIISLLSSIIDNAVAPLAMGPGAPGFARGRSIADMGPGVHRDPCHTCNGAYLLFKDGSGFSLLIGRAVIYWR